MNKQEAIKRIEQMGEYERFVDESISKASVLSIVSQIHEPQKVVVPKEVAEWIKSHKESFSDASAIDMYDNLNSDNRSGYYHEVWLWVIAHHYDFIKAWHDGYEIEKERLYTVEIPNPNANKWNATVLKRMKDNDNAIELCVYVRPDFSDSDFQLTESEIKEDFEWAWQFAKEVE